MRKLSSEQLCDFPKIFLLLTELALESRPPNSKLALVLLHTPHHISKLIPLIFRNFIYIIWTWQRNKAFIKLNICNVFSLKSPFLYFIIIKVQAHLILLPCAFLCFTDACVCVLQIEGLWPPCIDIGATFPIVFTHFKALCHILAIFTIFQAFLLLLYLWWWSVISDLVLLWKNWLAKGSDDGFFLVIKYF